LGIDEAVFLDWRDSMRPVFKWFRLEGFTQARRNTWIGLCVFLAWIAIFFSAHQMPEFLINVPAIFIIIYVLIAFLAQLFWIVAEWRSEKTSIYFGIDRIIFWAFQLLICVYILWGSE
jgi:hypothetical protein